MRGKLQHLPVLIFDLDDTLADTLGTLIPGALRRAAQAMIQAGVAASPAVVMAALEVEVMQGKGGDYFGAVAEELGAADPGSAASAGRRAYLTSDGSGVQLLPGARRLLQDLATDRSLHLVTAGDPTTQRAKIDRLGIAPYFDEVRLVSSLDGETKAATFRRIVEAHGVEAPLVGCIGDRLAGEIRDGNRVGLTTVWMRRGEFRHMPPALAVDHPDHTVTSLDELGDLLGARTP